MKKTVTTSGSCVEITSEIFESRTRVESVILLEKSAGH